MTVGTTTWEGEGVPRKGESEIVQQSASVDIITITGASSQTGDFLVCRNNSGTEKLYVDASGNVVASGFVAVKDNATTEPTTSNITADGGIMVAKVNNTVRLYFRQNGTVHYIDATA